MSMQNLQVNFSCLGWVWVTGPTSSARHFGAAFDAAFTISNSEPIVPESAR
jgi:hypothetical protein